MLPHFRPCYKQDILAATHLRKFETKLGEVVHCLKEGKDITAQLEENPAQYIVFGIPEDIGVIANLGKAGAATAWQPFVHAFLNIQSNDFLTGENILLAGCFDFSEEKKLINVNADNEEEKIQAYRSLVSRIDAEVEELVKVIAALKKIPVMIGGGHNNAYPAIKGAAKGLLKAGMLPLAQINCINLDAHTDLRPPEGRHSGNAFRYADEDGYLGKYCMIGVHENYIQQNVWMDIVNNPFMDCITYEDIFIHEKRNFIQALLHAAAFTENNYTGIELDLDAVERVLSSAFTPSGIRTQHARQYVSFMAERTDAAYLHICEGAAEMENNVSDTSTGKLISYLVADFIRAHSGKTPPQTGQASFV